MWAYLGFVHAGVVIDDLAAVVKFLNWLGLECGDPMTVEGEWVHRIIDLPDARVEAVMVSTADGTDTLECVASADRRGLSSSSPNAS